MHRGAEWLSTAPGPQAMTAANQRPSRGTGRHRPRNAAVHPAQPPAPHPPRHGRAPDAQRPQLRQRHHPPLTPASSATARSRGMLLHPEHPSDSATCKVPRREDGLSDAQRNGGKQGRRERVSRSRRRGAAMTTSAARAQRSGQRERGVGGGGDRRGVHRERRLGLVGVELDQRTALDRRAAPRTSATAARSGGATVTGCSVGRCSHHSAFDEVSSTPTRWPAGSFQSSP